MTTTPMAAEGLSRDELVQYAIAKYITKQVWYHGETVRLATDAYLKNIGGKVTLTRVTDKHDCKRRRYEDFGKVFELVSGYWQVVPQPTAREVFGEYARQRDTAILAQSPTRGRSKLFK